MLVGISIDNEIMKQRNLTWDEGLEQYKTKLSIDNWQLVFARAIDIYLGKVQGYRGVSERIGKRRQEMQARLKVMVKHVVRD